MEIDNTQNESDKHADSLEISELIQVRAVITCPSCDYRKKFKNQFLRKDIEMMVVSLKVFDWLTCTKCGELLKLDLEFKV